MNPFSAYTYHVLRTTPLSDGRGWVPVQHLPILRNDDQLYLSIRVTASGQDVRLVDLFMDQPDFAEQLQNFSVTRREVVILDFKAVDAGGNPIMAVCHWGGQIHSVDTNYLHVPLINMCQV